jgi:hypothetical protein
VSASAEQVELYDRNDKLVDVINLPPHYMEDESPRWIIALGRKFIEGGRPNSFYGKGQFAEVED